MVDLLGVLDGYLDISTDIDATRVEQIGVGDI